MELIKEEANKLVYKDGNKIYTMLNMGNYIGHASREWWEATPEDWRLMFYEEERGNGNNLLMEALVDQFGGYMHFWISLGNMKRVICLDGGMVYRDSIVEEISSDGLLGDSYVALNCDVYSSDRVLLNDYLNVRLPFKLGEQVYEGDLSDNSLIVEFLNKNDELRETMNQGRKRT